MIKLKDLIKEEKKNIFSDKILGPAQSAVDSGKPWKDHRYPIRLGGLGYVDAEQIVAHNESGERKHNYVYGHVYGVETNRGRGYNVETYHCRICGFSIKKRRSR